MHNDNLFVSWSPEYGSLRSKLASAVTGTVQIAENWPSGSQFDLTPRDNHAEGMVFSKRIDIGKTFSGDERTSKNVLKTYSQYLEKIFFALKFTISS